MNSRVSWSPLKVCPIRRTTNSLPTQTPKLWLQRAQQDLWSKANAENHILMHSPSTRSRSPLVSQQMRWSGPSCSVSVEAEFQNTVIPGTGAGRGGGVWRRADQIGIRECHGSVGAERGGRKRAWWSGSDCRAIDLSYSHVSPKGSGSGPCWALQGTLVRKKTPESRQLFALPMGS